MECVILDYKIFFANFVLASICSTESLSNKTAQKMKSSNWHIKKKKKKGTIQFQGYRHALGNTLKEKRVLLQDFFFLNFGYTAWNCSYTCEAMKMKREGASD